MMALWCLDNFKNKLIQGFSESDAWCIPSCFVQFLDVEDGAAEAASTDCIASLARFRFSVHTRWKTYYIDGCPDMIAFTVAKSYRISLDHSIHMCVLFFKKKHAYYILLSI